VRGSSGNCQKDCYGICRGGGLITTSAGGLDKRPSLKAGREGAQGRVISRTNHSEKSNGSKDPSAREIITVLREALSERKSDSLSEDRDRVAPSQDLPTKKRSRGAGTRTQKIFRLLRKVGALSQGHGGVLSGGSLNEREPSSKKPRAPNAGKNTILSGIL